MGPHADRDRSSNSDRLSAELEEVRLALIAFHRSKDTDSLREYAEASANRRRGTQGIAGLIRENGSVFFRVGSAPLTRYETSKNAYDFTELGNRSEPLQPGEVVELRFHHEFPPQYDDGRSTVIFGWLDFVSVDDLAASLAEGDGSLHLDNPTPEA